MAQEVMVQPAAPDGNITIIQVDLLSQMLPEKGVTTDFSGAGCLEAERYSWLLFASYQTADVLSYMHIT